MSNHYIQVVEEALQQITDNQHIDPQIVELTRHYLTNAYFWTNLPAD